MAASAYRIQSSNPQCGKGHFAIVESATKRVVGCYGTKPAAKAVLLSMNKKRNVAMATAAGHARKGKPMAHRGQGNAKHGVAGGSGGGSGGGGGGGSGKKKKRKPEPSKGPRHHWRGGVGGG